MDLLADLGFLADLWALILPPNVKQVFFSYSPSWVQGLCAQQYVERHVFNRRSTDHYCSILFRLLQCDHISSPFISLHHPFEITNNRRADCWRCPGVGVVSGRGSGSQPWSMFNWDHDTKALCESLIPHGEECKKAIHHWSVQSPAVMCGITTSYQT